jgi:hypothetical protein
MNTQTKLSELDAMKLANLRLRQQLLNNEVETFFRDVFAAYGNPGEQLALADNGDLVRKPEAHPAPPAPAAKAKAKKAAK